MKKFLLGLFMVIFINGYSQFNYLAANAVNTTTTYTDLGANGTAITTNFAGTAMTFDDDNSAIQNIGFNFVYNGTTFTQFVLNSNGFIKLGNTDVTSNDQYDISLATATETNIIAPFNVDLDAGTSPEYRVYTSGAVGSRVCTIQFKNVRDWNSGGAAAAQFANVQFQIRLYEGTNNIEFVYGTFTPTAAASTALFVAVGVRGSDANAAVYATKASSTAWSGSTFIDGPYPGNYNNARNNVLPTAGRTFRFVAVALPPNDAQITALFTLGKIPVGFAAGHTVTALVKNGGSTTITNLTVTLNITGANTFTNTQNIASLAAGASTTVTFAAFSPTTLGTNTVSVSVPSDDVNTNNSASQSQSVTYGAIGYDIGATSTGSVGYNTGSGIIANKYHMTGTGYIRTVNFFLAADGAGSTVTGQTVYAVVLDAAGTIIGQSANYVVVASEENKFKQLVITTPPSVTNADYYIGIAQTANAIIGGYFPIGTQTESPARSGAYYTAPLAGGSAPAENTTLGRFMIEAGLNSTLPVTIINFSGKRENELNLLSWTIATESNNKGFELERSADGRNFSSIGFISTKAENGNSTSQINYSFTDKKALAGTNYYRLKQVDNDGKFSYSSTIILKGEKSLQISAVYPNPAKEQLNVAISSERNEKASITVTDITGKIVMQLNTVLVTGDNNITMNVSALAKGSYYIRLISSEGAKTTQFIKN